MDGYGFKLNELKDDKKLKNDNYEIWERLITPYLFAAGAHEMIFGTDGQPPLLEPTITAALEHRHTRIRKTTLTGATDPTKLVFRQSTSIWMWDKSI